MRPRDPVVLAWVVGLGLAVIAYAVGPQHFLARLSEWSDELLWRLSDALSALSLAGRDAVRALALGVYVTFVLLALAVIRRGGRARAALFWISVLFWLLIGAFAMDAESNGRWAAALALAAFGAVTMTSRLRSNLVLRPPRGG